jgi:hypothetical protein
VLDVGDELDHDPRRQGVIDVVGCPLAEVADHADRLAGYDDQPRIEGIGVDGDGVEALADLERDRLPDLVEVTPIAALPGLQPGPPEDEGAVIDVLEVGLAVEAARDADECRGAAPGDLDGLGDADRASRGEEPADPEARAVASERGDPAAKGGDAGEDHDEAVHGRE